MSIADTCVQVCSAPSCAKAENANEPSPQFRGGFLKNIGNSATGVENDPENQPAARASDHNLFKTPRLRFGLVTIDPNRLPIRAVSTGHIRRRVGFLGMPRIEAIGQPVRGFEHLIAARVQMGARPHELPAQCSHFNAAVFHAGGEIGRGAQFGIDFKKHEVGFHVIERNPQALDLGDSLRQQAGVVVVLFEAVDVIV